MEVLNREIQNCATYIHIQTETKLSECVDMVHEYVFSKALFMSGLLVVLLLAFVPLYCLSKFIVFQCYCNFEKATIKSYEFECNL